MNKRLAIGLGILVALIAISVPIGISIYLSWRQAFNDQVFHVGAIADDVLRRTDSSTGQTLEIFRALKQAGAADPCSPENVRLMSRLDLGSDQVQALAYVENDTLICTSYNSGRRMTPVGPPAYTTPYGTQIRTNVVFPLFPDIKFLLTTDAQTGYSAAIHPNRPLDVFVGEPDVSVGVFSTIAKRPVVSRGIVKNEWLTVLGAQNSANFIDGDQLVSIRRSSKYALAAYAAIPSAKLVAGIWRNALILVPIGLLAGLVLALAVAHLVRQQMKLRTWIRMALKRNEFFLEYQPIIELRGGRCVGAEALIRWRRADGTMVRPDIFIPVAEESGLIHDITKYVMDRVAQDTAALLKMRPDLHIGINLSAKDLQMEGTAHLVRDLVRRMQVQPHNILVEATERGFMQADVARKTMEDMHAFDIRIAIDDFGTGYSSLSYLQKFKLDYLKIDKSFVDTMGGNAATSQVVHHIIEMAKSLKLEMIAEGVETEEQLRYLQEHGVQYAQGWLYSKALPFREFASYVAKLEKERA